MSDDMMVTYWLAPILLLLLAFNYYIWVDGIIEDIRREIGRSRERKKKSVGQRPRAS